MTERIMQQFYGWADRPEKAYYLGVASANTAKEAMAIFAKDATSLVYGRKYQHSVIVEPVSDASNKRNRYLDLLP